jgi:hypothetical protein
MVIKEFDRNPQRYINLILQSDKRMQMLMMMFIADNIIDSVELLRKFPREILLDLKGVNKSKDKEYIDEFISKYSLNESDYYLSVNEDKKYPNDKGEEVKVIVETRINIKPDDTIKQFVEEWSIANIRQRRLEELGI